jgi:hypothetical protein
MERPGTGSDLVDPDGPRGETQQFQQVVDISDEMQAILPPRDGAWSRQQILPSHTPPVQIAAAVSADHNGLL